jgi:hypothetical protein
MTSQSDHPVNDRGTHRRDAFISYSGKDWQFARFQVDVTPDPTAGTTSSRAKSNPAEAKAVERMPLGPPTAFPSSALCQLVRQFCVEFGFLCLCIYQ